MVGILIGVLFLLLVVVLVAVLAAGLLWKHMSAGSFSFRRERGSRPQTATACHFQDSTERWIWWKYLHFFSSFEQLYVGKHLSLDRDIVSIEGIMQKLEQLDAEKYLTCLTIEVFIIIIRIIIINIKIITSSTDAMIWSLTIVSRVSFLAALKSLMATFYADLLENIMLRWRASMWVIIRNIIKR